MSRGGEAPLPVRTEGAHIFFVDPAHRVLLYLRDDQPGLLFPNTWHALGGGLEPGETPAACLRRELREELELDLLSPAFFKTCMATHGLVHLFWQSAEPGLANAPLHEGQRLGWFSEQEIQALPDDHFAFGFRPLLLEFFRTWKKGAG